MTQAEVCACLRRTANAAEVKFDWLYGAFLHSVQAMPDGPGPLKDCSRNETALMDLGMAQEALDSFVWWLRKTADDLENERSFCKHE